MAQMKKVFVRGNVASLFGLSILRSYDFLAFPFRPETALSASSNASVLLISNSPWIFPAKIWVERLVFFIFCCDGLFVEYDWKSPCTGGDTPRVSCWLDCTHLLTQTKEMDRWSMSGFVCFFGFLFDARLVQLDL